MPHPLRAPRHRAHQENNEGQDGCSLSHSKNYTPHSIDSLKEEELCGAMEEPTRQTEGKIDNKEKDNKNYGLENDRGKFPVAGPESCYWSIVTDCHHETDKESPQREALSKEPLKITPQSKEGEKDKQDRINDIHQGGTSIRKGLNLISW